MFSWVKILYALNQPLKDRLLIEHRTYCIMSIYLVYECVSRICLHCGMIGHDMSACQTYGRIFRFGSNPKYMGLMDSICLSSTTRRFHNKPLNCTFPKWLNEGAQPVPVTWMQSSSVVSQFASLSDVQHGATQASARQPQRAPLSSNRLRNQHCYISWALLSFQLRFSLYYSIQN